MRNGTVRKLTQRVRATSPPHGRQVVRGQKHFEEALKRLALNKRVQTSGIQAESAEHIRERTQHLTGSRNLSKQNDTFTFSVLFSHEAKFNYSLCFYVHNPQNVVTVSNKSSFY